jgi:hypothetical protein
LPRTVASPSSWRSVANASIDVFMEPDYTLEEGDQPEISPRLWSAP